MPTKTASRPPTPSQGQSLVRFTGTTGKKRIQAVIRERIGAFQPHWVSLETFLLMRRDPQVAFGTAILRAPIVAMPYSVQGENPKIVAFVEHVLSKHYRRLALAGSLAIPFGFQVVAKEWEVQDLAFARTKEGSKDKESFRFPSAWTFKRFKSIDPRTLTLLVDSETDDWGGVEQRNSAAPEGKVRVGREGAVLWSYRQEDVWGALTGFPVYHQSYEPSPGARGRRQRRRLPRRPLLPRHRPPERLAIGCPANRHMLKGAMSIIA